MALYEELLRKDFLYKLEPLIRQGLLTLGPKGLLTFGNLAEHVDPSMPWIFARWPADRNCFLWSKIMFEVFGILPISCYNCYKIVAKPKTVVQLLKLKDLQEELALPSKCGVDLRGFNRFKGIYAGFWYPPLEKGLAGAKELFPRISSAVVQKVGFGLDPFIKRACTEFENSFGPSNKWTVPISQKAFEEELLKIFDLPPPPIIQPEFYKTHIMVGWLQSAHERGDETIKDLTFAYPEGFGSTTTVKYME